MVRSMASVSAVRAFVAAAALCGMTLPVLAETRTSDVAIMPFDRRKLDVELSDALADVFQVAFSRASRLSVLAQSDIGAMVGFEKQKELAGCEGGSCLAEIGGALGVRYIVTGRFARVGSSYLCLVKLIDVQHGSVVASDQETAPAEEQLLLEAVQKLGTRFGQAVATKVTPPPTTPVAPPRADPVPVAAVEPAPAPPPDPTSPPAAPEDKPRPRAVRKGSNAHVPPLVLGIVSNVAACACGVTCLGGLAGAVALSQSGAYALIPLLLCALPSFVAAGTATGCSVFGYGFSLFRFINRPTEPPVDEPEAAPKPTAAPGGVPAPAPEAVPPAPVPPPSEPLPAVEEPPPAVAEPPKEPSAPPPADPPPPAPAKKGKKKPPRGGPR